MRVFFLYALYGIAAISVQVTWLSGVPTQSVHVDLVLMAVVALSFTEGWHLALPVIVFLGALVDAASISPFGMSIFSYAVIYGAMRAVISKITFQIGFGRLFWIGMMSLTDKVACALMLFVWTGRTSIVEIWMRMAVGQALFDALVGFVLVPLIVWYGGITWEKLVKPKGLVMK